MGGVVELPRIIRFAWGAFEQLSTLPWSRELLRLHTSNLPITCALIVLGCEKRHETIEGREGSCSNFYISPRTSSHGRT